MRIKQLQTGAVYKIVATWTYETEYASKIERTIHRHYSYLKTYGEWHNFDDVSIFEVIEKIKNIEKVIKQLNENKEN